MEFSSVTEYRIVFWKGDLDDDQMILHSYKDNTSMEPLHYHRYILNLLTIIHNTTNAQFSVEVQLISRLKTNNNNIII